MQNASHAFAFGGERDRTVDLLRARQSLSQLSYTPYIFYIKGSRIQRFGGPSKYKSVQSHQSIAFSFYLKINWHLLFYDCKQDLLLKSLNSRIILDTMNP
jgi:hypothetical protein